jgi:hypothetical protein
MFLKHRPTGGLIEVLNLDEMFNPFSKSIRAKTQAGEDTMDTDDFDKHDLTFPSGEPLPLCWRDTRYRKHIAA